MPTTTLNRWGTVVWEIYSARTIPSSTAISAPCAKYTISKNHGRLYESECSVRRIANDNDFPILRQVSKRGKSETFRIVFENATRHPWRKYSHLQEIARFVPTILNYNARMDHDEIVPCRMLNWVRHRCRPGLIQQFVTGY